MMGRDSSKDVSAKPKAARSPKYTALASITEYEALDPRPRPPPTGISLCNFTLRVL
jgi:hypothetical protein